MPSSKRIQAREFLKYTTKELWQWLEGTFTVVFEDGEVVTNHKDCLYSSYFWDIHRKYPKTPLLVSHHVRSVIGQGLLRSETHLTMFSNITRSVVEAYRNEVHPTMDELAFMIYKLTNDIYNDLSYRLEPWVVSLDITDLVQVVKHPEIEAVVNGAGMDEASIEATFKRVNEIITKDPLLEQNPVSRSHRAGLVNKSQLMQCVAFRGYGSDVDSARFPVPIMRGFVRGFRSLYDSMVESRSMAMALYYSKTPLQMVEYFSRRLQLLCQTVDNLHKGDCGSTHYLTLRVRPAEFEGGKQIFEGDLPRILGKYYLDEHSHRLKPVKEGDTHLIGKTLRLRSIIAGCAHADPNGVCSTCFGELSYSVPERTNIGHMCSTYMAQQSSQSVLSTKHLVGSAIIEKIMLTLEMQKYLKISQRGEAYLLADAMKDKDLILKVASRFAPGISDVDLVPDISMLNISRVSKIEHVTLEVIDRATGTMVPFPAEVRVGKREASFTYDFLEFIKEKRWRSDEKANYVFDLTGWNHNKEIMTLPLKHTSTSEHSKEIADMIESSVKELKSRDQAQNPQAVLIELCDLINEKLHVNMAVVEVILHAALVQSMRDNNYALPKAGTSSEMGVSELTLANRSLAPQMAYEKQDRVSYSPGAFFYNNRPDHPMDVFLRPREVLEGR